jgi:hypothetical protein
MTSPNFTPDQNPKTISFGNSDASLTVPSHWSPDIVDDLARGVHDVGEAVLGTSSDQTTDQNPTKRIAFPNSSAILSVPPDWSDESVDELAKGIHTAGNKSAYDVPLHGRLMWSND